jgi:hypothetical protein
MMLDSNSLTILVFGSFIVGIITSVLPSGLGKLIAIVGAFPLVFLLIAAAILGTAITNISDSVTLINWFIVNFIPLIVAYACEGAGAGVVAAIKKSRDR